MASQIKDLRNLISDIRKRVDSICKEKCNEYGIDEEKISCSSTKCRKEDDVSDKTDLDESTSNDKNDLNDEVINDIKDIDLGNNKKLGDVFGNDKKFSAKDLLNSDSAPISIPEGFRKGGETYIIADLSPVRDGMGPEANMDANGNAGIGELAKRVITKGLTKNIAKSAGKRFGGKAASKVASNVAKKTIGKGAKKSILKKLPYGISLLPAAYYAGERALKGDLTGAALEGASGLSAVIPYVGTAGSVALDGYIANRDIERETGKGIIGHGKDALNAYASKTESYGRNFTLYDRARAIFESMNGINESVDEFCFDDYVLESKLDNLYVNKRHIDESKTFYGYKNVCENFSDSEQRELDELFRRLSPDGRISMSDLRETDSDTIERSETKKRIREILQERSRRSRSSERSSTPSSYGMNSKEYKKSSAISSNQSGRKTPSETWHTALDAVGGRMADNLSEYGIPHSWSSKFNLPRNIANAGAAVAGGLLFGPVGAMVAPAITNWLANNHEKYRAKKYAELHGLKEDDVIPERQGGIGSIVGSGLGSLVAGPIGAGVGSALGRLVKDRTTEGHVKTPEERSRGNAESGSED